MNDLAPLPRPHVARPPLPWREPTLTGCGRSLTDVPGHITRAEFDRKLKEFGYQRTGLTTCMTCTNTEREWPTFEQNPVKAMFREVSQYDIRGREGTEPIRQDLVALALLVEVHASEWAELRAGLDATVSLDNFRRGRADKARAAWLDRNPVR